MNRRVLYQACVIVLTVSLNLLLLEINGFRKNSASQSPKEIRLLQTLLHIILTNASDVLLRLTKDKDLSTIKLNNFLYIR